MGRCGRESWGAACAAALTGEPALKWLAGAGGGMVCCGHAELVEVRVVEGMGCVCGKGLWLDQE